MLASATLQGWMTMDSLSPQVQAALGARYRVMGVAAKGGMSTVLRAIDLKHDRVVAVKVLHEEVAGLLGSERFLREIRLIAQLQHPHVVPLFDSGAAGGLLYYTMPFVDGESLRDRLRQSGALPLEEALRYSVELCDALGYAHAHGVLHRDVKPDNILISGGHALLTDFGIARAIRVATVSDVSFEGLVVGTPAYMSPEQALGVRDLDERSDQYSLACVIYEMLSGRLPYSGNTPQALLSDRFRSPPQPLQKLRAEIPAGVERAVERALATDPEARFPSAAAFARELQPAARPTPRTPVAATHAIASGDGPTPPPRRRWTMVAAGALAVVGAVAGALWWQGRDVGRLGAIDPALYVVLPLAHTPTAALRWEGDDCARLLFDAIARWSGVRLVDEMRVRDALARAGGHVPSLAVAMRIARELGAGRLVWGSVAAVQENMELRATVYDVARNGGDPVAQYRVSVASNGDVALAVAGLADTLIVRTAFARGTAPAAGSRDLPALEAYVQGQRALDAWDLEGALGHFERAAQRDTAYAEAHLWAAEVASWLGGTRALQVTAHATAALAGTLAERPRLRARALAALGRSQPRDACSDYDALLARDSSDFVAWYGRGECLSRDREVVADAAAPSGWRFRASRHAAVSAYSRALSLVPSFQNAFGSAALERLEQLLLATTDVYIRGYRLTPDTAEFGAFPALDADTLSAVAWPLMELLRGGSEVQPPSYRAAIDRNRIVLTQLTGRWAREAPENLRAQEAFGAALENVGRIDTVRGVASALSQVQRARLLARASPHRHRLAMAELRLRLKLEQWETVRRLGDSLLANADSIPLGDVRAAASVALLLGRVGRGVDLARRGAVLDSLYTRRGARPVPTDAALPAYALAAWASTGGPADSLVAWRNATRRAIDQFFTPEERDDARELLLVQPLLFAFPTSGALPEHLAPPTNPFLRIEHALATGNEAAARAGLDSLDLLSARLQPGDEAPEFVFLAAWLRRATGDAPRAARKVTQYLASLPSTSRHLLDAFSGAAGVVRLQLLALELASSAGDTATARAHAQAVVTLWSGADPALQSYVTRARTVLAP
jgi:eukaryotic-like serine/threonine-protein kinase